MLERVHPIICGGSLGMFKTKEALYWNLLMTFFYSSTFLCFVWSTKLCETEMEGAWTRILMLILILVLIWTLINLNS